jgi:mevalonate kinase
LLTGEYLVLRGAKALAVPLKKGQSIEITETENDGHPHLLWYAFGPGKLWFKTSFELPSLDIIGTDDRKRSIKLQLILLTLKQLNPTVFDGKYSYSIKTHLEFEPEWGFGSSSTLIANLAHWAKVDPYTLLNLSIGGSGYDIACALSEKPLFYQLKSLRPTVQSVRFMPLFHEKLFLVYQGNKQDSGNEMLRFNQLTKDVDLNAAIQEASEITEELALTHSFTSFCNLMDNHEALISALLQHPPLKTSFPDFDGHIKSLGAWGGDFFLAMSNQSYDEIVNYFASKGLHTIFKYNELIF